MEEVSRSWKLTSYGLCFETELVSPPSEGSWSWKDISEHSLDGWVLLDEVVVLNSRVELSPGKESTGGPLYALN